MGSFHSLRVFFKDLLQNLDSHGISLFHDLELEGTLVLTQPSSSLM